MKKLLTAVLRWKDGKTARLKVLTLTILPLVILQLITGCGGENQPADKVANNFSGDAVKLGMLTPLNSTEDKMGEATRNTRRNFLTA